MNGQTLVEHRSRASFPSASLIKLAILADILDSHIQLDQMIPVHEDQLVGGAGVLQLLQPRDWKLRDLLALMISDSDNSATNVVISFIGMEHVQNYLKSNGFEQTKLNRYLMDGRSLALGIDNFTSAEESLRLLDSVLSMVQPLLHGLRTNNFVINCQVILMNQMRRLLYTIRLAKGI